MDSLIIQDWKMFAPIRVAGKKTYAHLDTGSVGNMVISSLAGDWEIIEERIMTGAIGEQRVKEVRTGPMEFLGHGIADSTAIVFEGSGYFGEMPFPVEMTLGAGVLLDRPLILDFKRLWLGYADSPIRQDIKSCPMESVDGLPFIELSINGRKFQTIIDTGAAYSLLNAAYAAEMHLDLDEIYRLEGRDPTGKTSYISVYVLDNLMFEELVLGKTEVVKMDLSAIERRLNRRVDFVLGANALISSRLVWVLDKAQEKVFVSERDVDVCV